MTRMRSEVEDKLEAILKGIRSIQSISTVTSPRSEIIDTQNIRPSGSGNEQFMRVRASEIENIDLEGEDYPLRASEMRELGHPILQNVLHLDETVIKNDHPEEGYNTPLYRNDGKRHLPNLCLFELEFLLLTLL